ncbi:hypothetical protein KIW84_030101 [Lathyrus oleraceus]|uniref:Uncharacterized protein n=1 Tax=Pisum sativum TaxID=3888 RepID=A0A9D5AYV2_PEA|nr:hypothetical protein KIW84_030097 [Pisum sativum]KAI5423740.1 hypothetical protein KIW84_030101 [Pisum sativum]
MAPTNTHSITHSLYNWFSNSLYIYIHHWVYKQHKPFIPWKRQNSSSFLSSPTSLRSFYCQETKREWVFTYLVLDDHHLANKWKSQKAILRCMSERKQGGS